MDSKDQSVSVFRRYLADMDRLGFRVHCIQTDRGSEFFEQKGECVWAIAGVLLIKPYGVYIGT